MLGKIKGQNRILEKHALKAFSSRVEKTVESIKTKSLSATRKKLLVIEARYSRKYFRQIFQLFPEKIRPEVRKTFKAYDGVNNIFNLAYELLSWKVYRRLIKAKLEPYLGFLHSVQSGKPSLMCDFVELYRFLIDDFVIQQCRNYTRKDFIYKHEKLTRKKIGKRQYVNDSKTRDLTRKLNSYFEKKVEIQRIRVGRKQTIETLINEEASLFAKYLRGERKTWIPLM